MKDDTKDKNYKNKRVNVCLHSLRVVEDDGERVTLRRFQRDCDFVRGGCRCLDRYPSQSPQRSLKHSYVDVRNDDEGMSHSPYDLCPERILNGMAWNDRSRRVRQLDQSPVICDLLKSKEEH